MNESVQTPARFFFFFFDGAPVPVDVPIVLATTQSLVPVNIAEEQIALRATQSKPGGLPHTTERSP